jgi:hypothetical protein
MIRRKPVETLILTVIFLILLPAKLCLANPLVPGYYIGQFTFAAGVDLVVDAAVLIVGYSILRRFDVIASWDFAKYVVIVMIAGLLIDLLSTVSLGSGKTAYALLAFTLLSLYNFSLSRKIFDINRREALVIGLFMGIFTNPAISFLFIHIYHPL